MALKGKKHLWILFILTFLASMVMISVPVTSSLSSVTFRVEPNITPGVAADTMVTVDVYIDAPPDTAVIAWGISIKVDPTVLKPGYWVIPGVLEIWASSSAAGYYLYDWCITNEWDPEPGTSPTLFLAGNKDEAAGTITGTYEVIKLWTELGTGVGANGTGKLGTFYFTSKSETDYSPIEITEAYYYTSWSSPDLDKRVPDVIISGHYNVPPTGTLTVSTTPVAGDIYVNGVLKATGSWSELVDIGTYTVSFGDVAGYITPANEIATVTESAVTTVTGVYELPTGTLSGTVTDADTGDPIAGATVEAVGPETKSTTTNASGQYLLADLPVGDYTVTASKDGYYSLSKPATVTENVTTTVDFALSFAPIIVHEVTVGGQTYYVVTESNSTVSNFAFNETYAMDTQSGEISFYVTGAGGTTGFCNITIPKNLTTGDPWLIKVNGETISTFDVGGNDTHTWLYFTYTHASSSMVQIYGTWVVPEFPTFMLLPLLMIATIVAAIISKKVWSTRRRGHAYQIKRNIIQPT